MLNRKKFRLGLYKLMLLKNIIENKIQKERMYLLYAFEQMVINTEDENNDPEYYDEMYGGEDDSGEEQSQMLMEGDFSNYQPRLGQYPSGTMFQRYPGETDYFSYPSDVIDEVECEETEDEDEKETAKSENIGDSETGEHDLTEANKEKK